MIRPLITKGNVLRWFETTYPNIEVRDIIEHEDTNVLTGNKLGLVKIILRGKPEHVHKVIIDEIYRTLSKMSPVHVTYDLVVQTINEPKTRLSRPPVWK